MFFGGLGDFHVNRLVALEDEDFFLADEFEEGEKDADHFPAGFAADDQASQGELSFAGEAVFDVGGVEIDGGVVVGDLVHARTADADFFHQAAEGGEEVPDLDFVEVEGRGLVGVADLGGGNAREALLVFFLAAFEERGGVFDSFIFQKLLDQLVARVGQLGGGGGFAFDGRRLGEEHGAFDFHEGGGHDEEVAGDVDVEAVLVAHGSEHVDVAHVAVEDAGDGDVVDIQLVALDEIEEKVEGAVIDVQFYAIFHESSLIGVKLILVRAGG